MISVSSAAYEISSTGQSRAGCSLISVEKDDSGKYLLFAFIDDHHQKQVLSIRGCRRVLRFLIKHTGHYDHPASPVLLKVTAIDYRVRWRAIANQTSRPD